MKEYLKTHESYDDFLAIVSTGKDDYHRRQNAEKVLEILQQLQRQQMKVKQKELEGLRQRASQWYFRNEAEKINREVNILSNRSLRLEKYKNLLCVWLIACVGNSSAPDPLTWKPGDTVPTVYKQVPPRDGPKFDIPRDFCCQISNEVMQDPVMTVENYIYERREIERW